MKSLKQQLEAIQRILTALENNYALKPPSLSDQRKSEPLDGLIDLRSYRNKVIKTFESLDNTTDEKKISDRKIIQKDRSPITKFFEKALHVISTALIIGAGTTIARMVDSQQRRGHMRFWKSTGYDTMQSVDKAKDNLNYKKPKK